MYAILSHGGRQYRVSAGDRLVVDRLEAEIGSIIALEPVLLTGGDGATSLGEAVVGVRVAATVVGHPRGRKLRIFKYKAKKRYRRVAGYRSDLTEVRIESIVGKGDELPTAAAAAAPRRAPRKAAAKADAPTERRSAKPAPAKRATPPRKPASSAAASGAKRAPAAKGGAAPAKPKRATTKKEPGDGA